MYHSFFLVLLTLLGFDFLVAAIPRAGKAYVANLASQDYAMNRMGLTITDFSSEAAAKASAQYDQSMPENPSFLLCNTYEDTLVTAIGEIIFADGFVNYIRDPKAENKARMEIKAIIIQPGHCTLVSHVTSAAGDHNFHGAFRGYLGCDKYGQDCLGLPNIITKVEFASNIEAKNKWGINLSMVDGYNGEIKLTAGANNETFGCHIDPEEVRRNCPKAYLLDHRNGHHPSCKSDCRGATGITDHLCCVGEYEDHGICQASSFHLAQMCNLEGFDHRPYFWPHDDRDNTYTVVTMTKALEIQFGPTRRLIAEAGKGKGVGKEKVDKKEKGTETGRGPRPLWWPYWMPWF